MSDMILVPVEGTTRGELASLLLAMADEAGIDRREIKRARTGYLVPRALVEGKLVEIEPEEVPVQVAPPASAPVDPPKVEPVRITEADEPDRETVRAWARENGFEVADKGQLKKSVYAAYEAAHKES